MKPLSTLLLLVFALGCERRDVARTESAPTVAVLSSPSVSAEASVTQTVDELTSPRRTWTCDEPFEVPAKPQRTTCRVVPPTKAVTQLQWRLDANPGCMGKRVVLFGWLEPTGRETRLIASMAGPSMRVRWRSPSAQWNGCIRQDALPGGITVGVEGKLDVADGGAPELVDAVVVEASLPSP